MDASLNGHSKGPNIIAEWVWFEGADALKEGEGVCYNTNYFPTGGAVTDYDARRGNRVERPSVDNNKAFAGVAARSYPARTNGQLIEIYVPGSKGVKVALGVNTVINTGMLNFQVGGGSAAGRFSSMGFAGRGAIIPRQTKTAVLFVDMAGATWSMATDGITLTVASTVGLAAGDTIVILQSDRDLLAGVKRLIPGKYEVKSITDGTDLVLTASAADGTLTAAVGCTGYAYTGNPTCQADLLTGEESGGVQYINAPTAGTDALIGVMAGGVSYMCGTVTLAADAEHDLVAGTTFGEKKGFWCLGTFTTGDFVIDALAGFLMAGTASAEIEDMDAPGDFVFLEWLGVWRTTCTNATEA